jgi:hypothetical protein
MSLAPRPALSTAVRLLFVAAALCSIFALSVGRADAAPWTAAEEASPAGSGAYSAQLGIDGEGDATAAWTEAIGGHSVLRSAERPVGGTWSAPFSVSGSTAEAEEPTLVENEAGDAVLAWRERSETTEAIQASVRMAGGGWGAVETFDPLGTNAREPAVAIDPDGNVAVAWTEGGGSTEIEAATMEANGAWSEPEPLSSPSENGVEAEVTVTVGGSVTVAWVGTAGGNDHVVLASKEFGGTWVGEPPLSTGSSATERINLASEPSGEVVAVWSRMSGGIYVVETARKASGGGWGSPEPISTSGQSAREPDLAVNRAGDAVIAWRSPEAGSNFLIEATHLRAGGSWTLPHVVSATGTEAEVPSVAIGPAGVAQVAWAAWNENGHLYETHAARLGPRGIWRAAIAVSRFREEALYPQVRISAGGHVVIVWDGYVSVGAVIKSSTSEETAPLIVASGGSGSGTVTSEPAGIDCGATCAASFLEGETVTLSAAPAAGSKFAGWSGACSGTGPCSLEIGEAQAVRAEFDAVGGEPGGGSGDDGSTPGGSTSNPGGGSVVNPGTPFLTKSAAGPVCTKVSAAKVSGFAPVPKPGQAVPGVRAKVTVKQPSTVKVSAMLGVGNGSSIRLADLGSLSFHTAAARNLHFALPASLRSALPLGSGARLILSIAAKPDAEGGCAQPSVVKRQMSVKVVKVLSGRQAGVS